MERARGGDRLRGRSGRLKRWASGWAYGLTMALLPAGRAPQERDTLAVVCLASLGDFLVFCSAARALKDGGKRLILICRRGSGIAEFAETTGYFERILEISGRRRDRAASIFELRKIKADTVIVAPPQRHAFSDCCALAMPANERILPDTLQACSLPKLKRAADRKADRLIPVKAVLERKRYEEYLVGCGLYEGEISPYVMEGVPRRAGDPSRRIAVFPGAGGGETKRWPVERFAYVAGALSREGGCEVLVLGTKSERSLGERLCALLPGAENLCGRTDLPTLILLLRECRLALANDSGSAHLARACGVPTVIVCGGWEYGRFYPDPGLPKSCRALIAPKGEMKCIPCGKSNPNCNRQTATAPCVLAITQEEALKAAMELENCERMRRE